MRAWAEIDLPAIRHNAGLVKKQIGSNVGLIAVVKTDAYGHGIDTVVETLEQCDVDMYAVTTLDEALRVRKLSRKSILLLNYLNYVEMQEAIERGFSLTLYDKELIAQIQRIAEKANKQARVHVKVETGLNRLGMSVAEACDFLTSQRHFPNITVEAVFSHLAKATDYESNQKQLKQLQEILWYTQGKIEILPFHLASSGALANFQEGYLDAVRVGLALYGTDELLPGLLPCLSFKSVVAQVKTIEEGEGVGYDHLWTAKRASKIAVVSAGYGEGFTQALTGKAEVLINGYRVPVVGKISMNLCMADVTNVPVKRGDEVVLVGTQHGSTGRSETIRVTDLAQQANLRHHEIVTRIGTTVPRRYIH